MPISKKIYLITCAESSERKAEVGRRILANTQLDEDSQEWIRGMIQKHEDDALTYRMRAEAEK